MWNMQIVHKITKLFSILLSCDRTATGIDESFESIREYLFLLDIIINNSCSVI